MLPLMACTCAQRAVEPIPHIRITKREILLARIVMAAPDTKISFVKRVGREQRLRVAAEILTVSRNRVAKPSCFRKDRTEGTEKVLSNELPRLLYVCENSITTDSKVEELKSLAGECEPSNFVYYGWLSRKVRSEAAPALDEDLNKRPARISAMNLQCPPLQPRPKGWDDQCRR